MKEERKKLNSAIIPVDSPRSLFPISCRNGEEASGRLVFEEVHREVSAFVLSDILSRRAVREVVAVSASSPTLESISLSLSLGSRDKSR